MNFHQKNRQLFLLTEHLLFKKKITVVFSALLYVLEYKP